MIIRTSFACALMISVLASGAAAANEKKEVPPPVWGLLSREIALEPRAGSSKPGGLILQRGMLVTILAVKSKGKLAWSKVGAINPATFEALTGWVESSALQRAPDENPPTDAELLKQLGGAYLDDFTASTAAIVRASLGQSGREPALVCFIGSRAIPSTRLQIFQKISGRYVAGPYEEFPAAEMNPGMTRLEALDLLGDGNECLLTEEPFNLQPQLGGANVFIRRVEGDSLKVLWKAPLEFRNLASYPAKREVLQPPERNIGNPGTVTTATVDFQARGPLREPAWKGKIEFHVVGREEPVDTVKVEKVCAWDGTKFAPLK